MNYRVVITGLKPGAVSKHETRANLAKLLQAPAEKIDKLLDSVPVVIKKNIDQELGEKYIKALSQAGVLAEVRPQEPELSLEPTQEKKPEPAPEFNCPQCGIFVQKVGKCSACLKKSDPAGRQNAAADKMAKRRERKEKIKQSALAILIDWIKGNIWKAGIVFILVPIFGSSFLISTVFYTKDKHLVYETLSSRTVCVKNPTNILEMYSNTDKDLFEIFWRDFNEEEKQQLLKKWNNVACRAIYEMELGNIGDEPVTANIVFATWRFVTGSRNPNVLVYPKFRDLSATTDREQNPEVKQEKGKYRLENIYPGTLVSLKFGGWIDGKDSAEGWEGMLTDINVDEGVVEVGDPRATTFGRLLTVFF